MTKYGEFGNEIVVSDKGVFQINNVQIRGILLCYLTLLESTGYESSRVGTQG